MASGYEPMRSSRTSSIPARSGPLLSTWAKRIRTRSPAHSDRSNATVRGAIASGSPGGRAEDRRQDVPLRGRADRRGGAHEVDPELLVGLAAVEGERVRRRQRAGARVEQRERQVTPAVELHVAVHDPRAGCGHVRDRRVAPLGRRRHRERDVGVRLGRVGRRRAVRVDVPRAAAARARVPAAQASVLEVPVAGRSAWRGSCSARRRRPRWCRARRRQAAKARTASNAKPASRPR